MKLHKLSTHPKNTKPKQETFFEAFIQEKIMLCYNLDKKTNLLILYNNSIYGKTKIY